MKKLLFIVLILSMTYSCSSLQRDPAQLTITKESKDQCVEKVKPEYNSYFDQYEKCVQP